MVNEYQKASGDEPTRFQISIHVRGAAGCHDGGATCPTCTEQLLSGRAGASPSSAHRHSLMLPQAFAIPGDGRHVPHPAPLTQPCSPTASNPAGTRQDAALRAASRQHPSFPLHRKRDTTRGEIRGLETRELGVKGLAPHQRLVGKETEMVLRHFPWSSSFKTVLLINLIRKH